MLDYFQRKIEGYLEFDRKDGSYQTFELYCGDRTLLNSLYSMITYTIVIIVIFLHIHYQLIHFNFGQT